jgi:hypothetical protein
MKKGKIILSAAAVLVTAGSALAFKVAKTFGHNSVFVKTPSGHLCYKCVTLTTGNSVATQCLASNNVHYPGSGNGINTKTFYKRGDCKTGTIGVKHDG